MPAPLESLEPRRLLSQMSAVELDGDPTPPPSTPPVVIDPFAGHALSARYVGTLSARDATWAGASSFDLKVYDDFTDLVTLGDAKYGGTATVRKGRLLLFKFHGGLPVTPDFSTTHQRLTLRARLAPPGAAGAAETGRGTLRIGYERSVTRVRHRIAGTMVTTTVRRWQHYTYPVRIERLPDAPAPAALAPA